MLPIRESLFELYLWFGQERGMDKNDIEDLNLLGVHMYSIKDDKFYNERKRKELKHKSGF